MLGLCGLGEERGKPLKFCRITVVVDLLNFELSFTKPVVQDLGACSDTGKRSMKREKGRDFHTQQERRIGTVSASATSVTAGSADQRGVKQIHGQQIH